MKTVIEMAREAGITQRRTDLDLEYRLNVFAALVREQCVANASEDEREKPCGNCYNLQERIDYLEERLDDIKQQEPLYFGLTQEHTWLSTTEAEYNKLNEKYRMKVYTTPPTIEAAVLAEREACAKVCEKLKNPKDDLSAYSDGWIGGAFDCAAAIRARGEK